ncbi:MAG: metallophosphoesterase family protein [Candidatus Nezhaarchaeales archaeon]
MKLLVLSDAHGNIFWVRRALNYLERLDVDAITYSGDSLDEEIVLELAKAKVPVFAVPGNMDSVVELEASERVGISVHGKVASFKGYVFTGVGAVNFNLAEKTVRDELGKRLHNPGRLILVTHFPPKGTRADVAFYRVHIGSLTVKRLIEDFKPVLCACGHVHESRAIDTLGETLIVNPGPVKHGFGALVDLDGKKAELVEID